jgi:hypothetical protein
MPQIRLRINFESQEEAPFKAFLEAFQARIGMGFDQLSIERYWKFPEQLQAEILLSTSAQSHADRVYEILQFANQLSEDQRMGWVFNGPHDSMGLVFECFYNNRDTDHPLKWAMIAIE